MTAVARELGLAVASLMTFVCVLGFMPQTATAQEARERRSDIIIRTNAEFDAAHGVRSGSGTLTDPYVISGWDVNNITIKDTSKHVSIVNNTIQSVLTLDWIGHGTTVRDNDINDLRVNQNVVRTGLPTSGVISYNTFTVVGQLRHFDGVFEYNTVGVQAVGDADKVMGEFLADRAVNFDGFNGAQFRNNTIYGYVEARLHGHHHSSGFGDHSHQHAGGPDGMDHTDRYHEVWITNNEITVAPGTFAALQYVDNNHAGNDRTATSETNPDLNLPHIHHTQVHITDNHLMGGGLAVEIFNADDENHISTARGRVEIDRNTVMLEQSLLPFSWLTGITVRDATDADVYLRDNLIVGPHTEAAGQEDVVSDFMYSSVGFDLTQIDKAHVRLYDNTVEHTSTGISANTFTDSRWFLGGTQMTDVDEPTSYSTSSVPLPEERSADPDPDSDYQSGEPPAGHEH